MRRSRLLAALVLTAGAAAATADVVTTKDGLVLEGTTSRAPDGSLTVTTPDGVVRLPAARVATVTPGEGPRTALRRELSALPAPDAEARYRLALRAESAGFSDVAREAWESVVRADPEHAAARRALGQEKVDGTWMPGDEARRRRGLVLYGGKWLLPVEAEAAARAPAAVVVKDATLASTMRTAARGEPALAHAAAVTLARTDPAARLPVAAVLLRDADPAVRTWACGHLASLGDESALRPLLVSAIRDRDADVRAAAVKASASFGHDDVLYPFLRELGSENPAFVANAAHALALLGDPRAIHVLVRRISHGSSPRAVVEFGSQISYVSDYDVEVAQSSNIADPIIGVIQEGVVLDVKVLDVSIDETYVETVLVDAFNALAGAHAKDAGGVIDWYRRNARTIPELPAKPTGHRKPAVTPSSAR
jgi:nitroreductase